MSGDSVEPENSSLNMKTRISCPSGFPPETSHTSSFIPESPYSNGSVQTGVSDGCDSIQSYSPSTSGLELEKSYGVILSYIAGSLTSSETLAAGELASINSRVKYIALYCSSKRWTSSRSNN